MKKLAWSLLVAMVVTAPCPAQVINIAKTDRVENFGDGFCAWCSLEMLGRAHKIENLYGLAKNRSKESDFKTWDGEKWVQEPYVWVPRGENLFTKEKNNPGSEWAIYTKMNALDVSAKYQWPRSKKTDLISYAMTNKLGCMFVIEGVEKGKAWAHAMVLVDFNDKEVMYVDPNDIEKVYTKSRVWFDKSWNGFVVVVEPTNKGSIVTKSLAAK